MNQLDWVITQHKTHLRHVLLRRVSFKCYSQLYNHVVSVLWSQVDDQVQSHIRDYIHMGLEKEGRR